MVEWWYNVLANQDIIHIKWEASGGNTYGSMLSIYIQKIFISIFFAKRQLLSIGKVEGEE